MTYWQTYFLIGAVYVAALVGTMKGPQPNFGWIAALVMTAFVVIAWPLFLAFVLWSIHKGKKP